jgi:hypothetical protein
MSGAARREARARAAGQGARLSERGFVCKRMGARACVGVSAALAERLAACRPRRTQPANLHS